VADSTGRGRILVLIKSLGGGGAERLLVDGLAHVDRDRFAYRVVHLLRRENVHVASLENAGFPVTCIGERPRGLWPARLRALIRTEGIDLVHAHSPLMAAGARLVTGVPVVYTEHSLWSSLHPLTRFANRVTFPRNAHAFAVSETVRSSISRAARSGPAETLRYGVDLDVVQAWRRDPVDLPRVFGLPEDALVAVTVANLREVKGHEVLLKAAARVKRVVPNAHFVLVGDGPLRARLARVASDLGVDASVVFAGFRDDAGRIVAGGELFVLPSLSDGLSVALVEAMALGRAVAITSVGGNVEVLGHGGEGLVVPPSDPEALAEAMIALFRDASLRARLGQAAAARARGLDIRLAVRRHEAVYASLLDHEELGAASSGSSTGWSSQRSA
jgi:glycosyltransferase involved in cell wall biosynthesis